VDVWKCQNATPFTRKLPNIRGQKNSIYKGARGKTGEFNRGKSIGGKKKGKEKDLQKKGNRFPKLRQNIKE